MAPTGQAHLDFALAALSAIGGAIGFFKKGSKASLLGGLGFGAAYATSGYLVDRVDAFQGHSLGCVSSMLLVGAMGSRFLRTKKVMPAGLMAGAGLVGLVYHAKKVTEWA